MNSFQILTDRLHQKTFVSPSIFQDLQEPQNSLKKQQMSKVPVYVPKRQNRFVLSLSAIIFLWQKAKLSASEEELHLAPCVTPNLPPGRCTQSSK